MHLTVDELRTYRDCPDRYMYKYALGLDTQKRTASIELSNAVHQVLYFYYFGLLDGRMRTETELRNKFQELWYKPQDTLEFLFSNNSSKLVSAHKAVSMINTFYRLERANPGIPIVINKEVPITLGGHQLKVKLEVVREITENGKRLIEIVDFKTSNVLTEEFAIDEDINMTLMSLAYRTMFLKKEDRLVYYQLSKGKKIPVLRSERHFERLKRLVSEVVHGIENKHYYPRVSHKCNQCPYKEVCKEWPYGFDVDI